ncbi:MAG: KAP family P-loop NTPase fold protein [Candidatus Anammoxibacter sp.]
MLNDEPITVKDVLETENERERIIFIIKTIESLLKENREGNVTISFNGDWGSGKSTYLKTLESYFREYRNCPVMFYEAWRYQEDENPLIPLILAIKEIPGVDSSIRDKFNKILKPILASGIVLSDAFLKSFTGGQGIDSITKAFDLLEKDQLKIISKYKRNIDLLSKTINNISNNYSPPKKRFKEEWDKYKDSFKDSGEKKPFVLIIDDLDRLLPAKAFKIIETLRFYFNIDNVLIIMGINDQILEGFVKEQFGIKDNANNEDITRGEKFLEKIFHWKYEFSYTGLNDLHLRSISKLLKQNQIENIKEILSNLDSITHRKWIKLINRIESGTNQNTNDSELKKIVFNSVVQELYPKFEYFSRKFPVVLNNLYEMPNTDIDIVSSSKQKDNVVSRGISEIINDGSFLEFPKENFKAIKESTLIKEKKTAVDLDEDEE